MRIAAKRHLLVSLKVNGLTQKEFAEKLGITRFHLNSVIKNKAFASEVLAKKVCEELGKSFDELFKLVDLEESEEA